MGAENFENFVETKETAETAFMDAVEKARYDYGHAGYTGTIAEKHEFEIRGTAPTREAAVERARRLMEQEDHDKWGPAWCIEVREPRGFLFFGTASS